jgi:Fur family ferric uptake transcriptional regulator
MRSISNKTSTKSKDVFKSDRRTLKATGLRATNQRALVLDIILRGGGHLDADEVYRQARKKQPQISLSTVYRALHSFKTHGLVEEFHFDEEHHHYEAKSGEEHHHLICLKCGKIIEFQYPLSRLVKKNVPQARGYEIIGAEVRMTGLCPKCQAKK